MRSKTARRVSGWILLLAACSDATAPGQPCGTDSGEGCAPDSQRVDLYTPVFSNPLLVDNPWFPISDLHSVVFTGTVDGAPFRTETTLFPRTRVMTWNGAEVEVLVQQYAAFSDGRLQELAIDWYAQDDAGAVWYFGEDVYDYDENGVVFTKDGTWEVGVGGAPLAMIMSAEPALDQVWRAENIAPAAFEEVTVVEVGATRDGPSGLVTDVAIGSELHMDETRQEKVFAPGYGEFSTGSIETDDLEALALAVPTDALSTPPPAEIGELASSTADLYDAGRTRDWTAATASRAAFGSAWAALRAGRAPPRIEAEVERVLVLLDAAIAAEEPVDTQQLAIDLARLAFDLRLRHVPPSEIDRTRFDLWLAQLLVDAADGGAGDVRGDVSTLELVWDRIAHTFSAAEVTSIEAAITSLRSAADASDLAGAMTHAAALRARFGPMGWRTR
jgi:hypothetical protein